MSPEVVRLDEQKLARAALTYLAEPAHPALGALPGICEPAEVMAAIKAGMLPGTGPGCGDSPASRRALEGALGRWRARLGWRFPATERCCSSATLRGLRWRRVLHRAGDPPERRRGAVLIRRWSVRRSGRRSG
jgi:hypothetical protein